MKLLTARRAALLEEVSLTRSVDAALGFVTGCERCPPDLAEEVLFAVALSADAADANDAARRCLAESLSAVAHGDRVSSGWLVDRLLDIRAAARPVPSAAGAP